MLFRSWGRCVVSLAFLSGVAALGTACGSDDQPPAGGGNLDGGASDATVDGNGTLDGTVDGAADAVGSEGGAETSADAPLDTIDDPMPFDGPVRDVDPGNDAGCGTKGFLSNMMDAGVCEQVATYTCNGVDQYEIDCSCPAATCTCSLNGNTVGTPVGVGNCATCGAPDYTTIAAACGIPY